MKDHRKLVRRMRNVAGIVLICAVVLAGMTAFGKYGAVNAVKNSEGLYSTHMLLMDLESLDIVIQIKSDEKIYPASLTKIMTAIVCLEAADDLSEKVSLSQEDFDALNRENASMAGFSPGEQVSVSDMFYGMMLPSGADAAVTLAKKYFGSEENCAMAMNGRADTLGMHRTHFTNVTGLHDDAHYTTLEDMAKLLVYALDNQMFRKIFTTSVYETAKTKEHPEGIVLESTFFSRISLDTMESLTLLGGKTGFTHQAGLCLATLANAGGKEYILITADAPGRNANSPFHIVDAVNVYENLTENCNS
ncbi:MAG TPA: D-alanyl-D-alanine carboxypeptidase [Candidatus Scybalocola faecipullorum]|nr:D-alanyl-D-alanine carboxypeptidase [Candidatus Scybalocola faecipullorum]